MGSGEAVMLVGKYWSLNDSIVRYLEYWHLDERSLELHDILGHSESCFGSDVDIIKEMEMEWSIWIQCMCRGVV